MHVHTREAAPEGPLHRRPVDRRQARAAAAHRADLPLDRLVDRLAAEAVGARGRAASGHRVTRQRRGSVRLDSDGGRAIRALAARRPRRRRRHVRRGRRHGRRRGRCGDPGGGPCVPARRPAPRSFPRSAVRVAVRRLPLASLLPPAVALRRYSYGGGRVAGRLDRPWRTAHRPRRVPAHGRAERTRRRRSRRRAAGDARGPRCRRGSDPTVARAQCRRRCAGCHRPAGRPRRCGDGGVRRHRGGRAATRLPADGAVARRRGWRGAHRRPARALHRRHRPGGRRDRAAQPTGPRRGRRGERARALRLAPRHVAARGVLGPARQFAGRRRAPVEHHDRARPAARSRGGRAGRGGGTRSHHPPCCGVVGVRRRGDARHALPGHRRRLAGARAHGDRRGRRRRRRGRRRRAGGGPLVDLPRRSPRVGAVVARPAAARRPAARRLPRGRGGRHRGRRRAVGGDDRHDRPDGRPDPRPARPRRQGAALGPRRAGRGPSALERTAGVDGHPDRTASAVSTRSPWRPTRRPSLPRSSTTACSAGS